MFSKILVPLDGSKRAETILPYVQRLALQNKSTVVLLQVLEPSAALVTPYDMVPYYDAGAMEQRTQEATGYLAGLCGEISAEGTHGQESHRTRPNCSMHSRCRRT